MAKRERDIYIANTDADQAYAEYCRRLPAFTPEQEIVPVVQAAGRVTAEAVFARMCSPFYNASAMDGIALLAAATAGATEIAPRTLVAGRDFMHVNTGDPVPAPFDAVVMIEDVMEIGDGNVRLIAPATPWQHIRPVGEDIVAGEMVLPGGHTVRPLDIGALLSAGLETIAVRRQVRVGIIPTGSELVESTAELKAGKIIESNSRVQEALVRELGCLPHRYPPCPDDYDRLKACLLKALAESDLVIVNAGSSAGTKDFTARMVRELGEVVVHGLALRPGKPTILGIAQGKAVIGLPGYPVSSFLVFDTFVRPLLCKWSGGQSEERPSAKAVVCKRIVSSAKNKELVRVSLGFVGERLIATPLTREAGSTMSLVRADGLAIIARNCEGIEAGEEVTVTLWKPLSAIRDTLVSIGSHDLILDLVADMMKLSSGHVGSMGGILALKRRECHLAPIHLLDEESGAYNVPFVRRFFPDRQMALVRGVGRLQGLIVAKGNPCNVRGIDDLARDGIRFANRQRGAGTRMLLDFRLKQAAIDTTHIYGYDREMTTHMAVAMAVKSGAADAGLGILSAARALDLDFIEVAHEQYDFLTPADYLALEPMQKFIAVLQSPIFRQRVQSLGGYQCKDSGDIYARCP